MSETPSATIQYVSDENGNPTGVIVPIELWREISARIETDHLLKSEVMRRRRLEARNRTGDIPWEAVLEELEAIRAFDEARASGDEAIPFEQAIEELERDRT